MARASTISTASDLVAIRWRLGPAVVLSRTPVGSYLCDLDRGFFKLEGCAGEIVEAAAQGGSAAAVEFLVSRYGISRDLANSDVQALQSRLRDEQLVERGLLRRNAIQRIPASLGWLCASLASLVVRSSWLSLQRSVNLLLSLAWVAVRAEGFVSTQRRWSVLVSVPRILPLEGIHEAILDGSCRYFSLPVSCKERALTGMLLLRAAGFDATVFVGVSPSPFLAHAWVETNGFVVGDVVDVCRQFRVVAQWERPRGHAAESRD
ncbi:MAG: lasso peptide biosynthesis B2 protein [Planctomycetaceae bacterium]|nr:lasso peptide biosynthesis B2 protein [Planctomycetaceae bacterium]